MKVRVAVAALALCLLQSLPCISYGTIASPQADQQLKAMENKFFEHDFSREAEEYRLQRLEKFAFGETQKGTVDERLGRLVKVIDLHKNLVAQKPAQVPVAPPAVAPVQKAPAKSAYSRELDDDQPQQSAHDKMKWVEDYRPKQPYSEPMQSVVGGGHHMSEEDRELAMYEAHFAEKATKPLPSISGQSIPQGLPNAIQHLSKELPAINASFSQLQQTYDPAVFGDLPPDHHARMLTRVAWCEQHVFGKTFPQLHLPARLHQLNAELFPNDRESDFQLMDRLDVIVREVVMQQHPPIAYNKQ